MSGNRATVHRRYILVAHLQQSSVGQLGPPTIAVSQHSLNIFDGNGVLYLELQLPGISSWSFGIWVQGYFLLRQHVGQRKLGVTTEQPADGLTRNSR